MTTEAKSLGTPSVRGHSARLWWRQVRVIVDLEMRKRVADKRSWWVYLLAAVPVVLWLLLVLFGAKQSSDTDLGELIDIYAVIYEPLLLRAIVFLGCVGIFTGLFRGEILQGSLHYYYLAPVRREVLVVGKYAAGVLISAPIFALATIISLAIAYVPFMPPGSSIGTVLNLLADHGTGYVAAVVLACLGYGAVFLFTGLVFRNPIIPAALVLGWEYINFLLPPFLKQFSVIHYLRSFLPVQPSEGPYAMLADPAPIWLATFGLLGFTAVMLAASMIAIRRVDIDYGTD